MKAVQFFIGKFETVEDIDPDALRTTIYMVAYWNNFAEVDWDSYIFTYQISDLNAISLSYFDVAYDWTQLNDRENIHYYDEATQTIVVREPFPFAGGGGYYTVKSVEANGNGIYVAVCDFNGEFGNFVRTDYLTMRKTQYGYVAVSFQ